MPKDSSRKRRTVLSVEQKLQILRHLQNGTPVERISGTNDIHISTVYRIQNQSGKIRQLLEERGAATKARGKAQNEELEQQLYNWFLERRASGDPITNVKLREKASELNQELGGPSTFKASSGWLKRFKARCNINHLNTYSESVDKFVSDFARMLQDNDVNLNNLYSVDETGLLWKCLPDRILIRAGENRNDERKLKRGRITIGMCTNATGTHKLPPLFVHRYATPRALKHCWTNLPVIYKAQRKGCVDLNLFVDWYKNDFKSAVIRYQQQSGNSGKVILLMDTCSRHDLSAADLEDDIFKIVFLPPNTTSILQPMAQGPIGEIKKSFRNKMLQRLVNCPGGVSQFYYDYDIRDCMDILHEAWTNIDIDSIRRSWSTLLKKVPEAMLQIKPEPQWVDTADNLQNLIETILNEQVPEEEIEDWLSMCGALESQDIDISEDEIKEEEEGNVELEENETERMFRRLLLWSRKQPEYVKTQVICLNAYYHQN